MLLVPAHRLKFREIDFLHREIDFLFQLRQVFKLISISIKQKMKFDTNNRIVQLCAAGMNCEGEKKEALRLFQQAWNEASNPLEKFIAAHYLARQQETVVEKLKWDETALEFALQLTEEDAKGSYP